MPTREPGAPSHLRAWAPWIAGAAGLLLTAAVIVLAMQIASGGHRVEALEARAAALAAEVEALRATEVAAALRAAELRAQLEALRRQVDGLSARPSVPAVSPSQPVPRAPPPKAGPPRTAPGR